MIERVKSVLLILLILCTMVLGYLNLDLGLVGDGSNQPTFALQSFKFYDFMRPHSFHYAVGGISFAKLYDPRVQESVWGALAPKIANILSDSTKLVEIDLARYANEYRGGTLILNFPVYVTAKDLTQMEAIGAVPGELFIDEILVGAKNLLIYDKSTQKRYEVFSGAPSVTAEEIRAAVGDHVTNRSYRRLSDRFSLNEVLVDGVEHHNYVLIPYQYDYIVPSFEIRKEFDPQSEFQIFEVARRVFGSNLDFVKQLVDAEGSTVLMYGYGDRSLTFGNDGVISYKSKPDGSRIKSTWLEAMQIAVSFLEALGPLPEGIHFESVIEHSPYDFEFSFAYTVQQYEVTDEKGDAVTSTVRVKSKQVTEARRHVVSAGEALPDPGIERMYSVDRCLSDYQERIVEEYLLDLGRVATLQDPSFNSDDYFFSIRAAIREIQLVMMQQEQRLEPHWRVGIGDRVYLFRAHDGRLR